MISRMLYLYCNLHLLLVYNCLSIGCKTNQLTRVVVVVCFSACFSVCFSVCVSLCVSLFVFAFAFVFAAELTAYAKLL